jgi:N-acetylglucosaminyldiphosphoundecaprenol N-acetyl-beta-D-mannosaminyltransferase
MNSVRVLGVRVDKVDRSDLETSILSHAHNGRPSVYAYVNVHAINIARCDDLFRDFINNAFVTYCDGEGVRLGARLLGDRLPRRTVLTYWAWDLCRLMEQKGLSIYLLGGRSEVVTKAVQVLRQKFQNIKITGCHHGYFMKTGPESQSVVEEINNSGADILFVGFGMPLQEHWIDAHLSSLRPGIVLPSGSMIDYIAGEKKQTPAWMANSGLEWLYRLLREPRRLWRRYLIGNPLFIFRVIAQRLRLGEH